jgi:hypothetical protein
VAHSYDMWKVQVQWKVTGLKNQQKSGRIVCGHVAVDGVWSGAMWPRRGLPHGTKVLAVLVAAKIVLGLNKVRSCNLQLSSDLARLS